MRACARGIYLLPCTYPRARAREALAPLSALLIARSLCADADARIVSKYPPFDCARVVCIYILMN